MTCLQTSYCKIINMIILKDMFYSLFPRRIICISFRGSMEYRFYFSENIFKRFLELCQSICFS